MTDEQPSLKDRIDDALEEARTLILGTQVLLGFGFRSAFERGFKSLDAKQQWASLGSLILLLLILSIVLLPVCWHLITERGADQPSQYRLTTICMALALPLFALAIGIDLEVAAVNTAGPVFAMVGGVVGSVLALILWYGTSLGRKAPMPSEDDEVVPLKDKIRQALTETRVVLPGGAGTVGLCGDHHSR